MPRTFDGAKATTRRMFGCIYVSNDSATKIRHDFLQEDQRTIDAGTWDAARLAALRRALGFKSSDPEWRAAQKCRTRKHKKHTTGTLRDRDLESRKMMCSRTQRLAFLEHWTGEVKKRQWYRWEHRTFKL